MEEAYARIQLPQAWATQLDADLAKAIAGRHGHEAQQREALQRTRTRLDGERRKLLEAYYAEAISLELLRVEQQRLDRETRVVEDRLAALEATLEQWRPVLATAHRFAADCGTTYRRADGPTRKVLNQAVLQRIELRDGRIAEVDYQPPFDLLFGGSWFQYRTEVDITRLNPNTLPTVNGPTIRLPEPFGAGLRFQGRGRTRQR